MKAFLTGLGTGIALGVWFAPRSGEETRRQLRDRADEFAGMAQERLGRLQQRAGELQDRAENLGREVTVAAQRVASDVKETARNVENTVLDRLNSGSRDQLMSIPGVGPVTADKIIAARPFTSAREIVDRGIVPDAIFQDFMREFKAA
jgi:DNA uptake protein ComE-like DNA-binding protein